MVLTSSESRYSSAELIGTAGGVPASSFLGHSMPDDLKFLVCASIFGADSGECGPRLQR